MEGRKDSVDLIGHDLVSALEDSSFDSTPSTPSTPPSHQSSFHPSNAGIQPLSQKRGLPPLSLSTSAPSSPVYRPPTASRQLFSSNIDLPGSPNTPLGSPSVKLPGRIRSVSGDMQTYVSGELETPTTPASPRILRNQKDKEPKKVSLYKTELCRSWEETGTCRYGTKCQFAHSYNEVRVVDRHPKYKTEMCKTFWEKGTCPYGKRCCFIHTERDAFEKDNKKFDLDLMELKSPRTRSVSEGFSNFERLNIEKLPSRLNDSYYNSRPRSAHPLKEETKMPELSAPKSAFPSSVAAAFSNFDDMADRFDSMRLATSFESNPMAPPNSPFSTTQMPLPSPLAANNSLSRPINQGSLSRGRRGFPTMNPPGLPAIDTFKYGPASASVGTDQDLLSASGLKTAPVLPTYYDPTQLPASPLIPPQSPWGPYYTDPTAE